MTTRATAATAALLAVRLGGTTARELASKANVSIRCAEQTLAALVVENILMAEVPHRHGRGPWPNRFRASVANT
jgi:predicted HTH transcriptional regulator